MSMRAEDEMRCLESGVSPPLLDRDMLQALVLREVLKPSNGRTLPDLISNFLAIGDELIRELKECVRGSQLAIAEQRALMLSAEGYKMGLLKVAESCTELAKVIATGDIGLITRQIRNLEKVYGQSRKVLKAGHISGYTWPEA